MKLTRRALFSAPFTLVLSVEETSINTANERKLCIPSADYLPCIR